MSVPLLVKSAYLFGTLLRGRVAFMPANERSQNLRHPPGQRRPADATGRRSGARAEIGECRADHPLLWADSTVSYQ